MLPQLQQDSNIAIAVHRLSPGKFGLLVETGRDLHQCSPDRISEVQCKVVDGGVLTAETHCIRCLLSLLLLSFSHSFTLFYFSNFILCPPIFHRAFSSAFILCHLLIGFILPP